MKITHLIEQLLDFLIQFKKQQNKPDQRSLKNCKTVIHCPDLQRQVGDKANGKNKLSGESTDNKQAQITLVNVCCSLGLNDCSLTRERGQLQRMRYGKKQIRERNIVLVCEYTLNVEVQGFGNLGKSDSKYEAWEVWELVSILMIKFPHPRSISASSL